MSDEFTHHILRMVVARICQPLGVHGMQSSVCDALADILKNYLLTMAKTTAAYSWHANRTDPTLGDLEQAFQDLGVSLPDLAEFTREVDSLSLVHHVPLYPVPRSSSHIHHPHPSTGLVGAESSLPMRQSRRGSLSSEDESEREHIPPYLPPLPSQRDDKVDVAAQDDTTTVDTPNENLPPPPTTIDSSFQGPPSADPLKGLPQLSRARGFSSDFSEDGEGGSRRNSVSEWASIGTGDSAMSGSGKQSEVIVAKSEGALFGKGTPSTQSEEVFTAPTSTASFAKPKTSIFDSAFAKKLSEVSRPTPTATSVVDTKSSTRTDRPATQTQPQPSSSQRGGKISPLVVGAKRVQPPPLRLISPSTAEPSLAASTNPVFPVPQPPLSPLSRSPLPQLTGRPRMPVLSPLGAPPTTAARQLSNLRTQGISPGVSPPSWKDVPPPLRSPTDRVAPVTSIEAHHNIQPATSQTKVTPPSTSTQVPVAMVSQQSTLKPQPLPLSETLDTKRSKEQYKLPKSPEKIALKRFDLVAERISIKSTQRRRLSKSSSKSVSRSPTPPVTAERDREGEGEDRKLDRDLSLSPSSDDEEAENASVASNTSPRSIGPKHTHPPPPSSSIAQIDEEGDLKTGIASSSLVEKREGVYVSGTHSPSLSPSAPVPTEKTAIEHKISQLSDISSDELEDFDEIEQQNSLADTQRGTERMFSGEVMQPNKDSGESPRIVPEPESETYSSPIPEPAISPSPIPEPDQSPEQHTTHQLSETDHVKDYSDMHRGRSRSGSSSPSLTSDIGGDKEEEEEEDIVFDTDTNTDLLFTQQTDQQQQRDDENKTVRVSEFVTASEVEDTSHVFQKAVEKDSEQLSEGVEGDVVMGGGVEGDAVTGGGVTDEVLEIFGQVLSSDDSEESGVSDVEGDVVMGGGVEGDVVMGGSVEADVVMGGAVEGEDDMIETVSALPEPQVIVTTKQVKGHRGRKVSRDELFGIKKETTSSKPKTTTSSSSQLSRQQPTPPSLVVAISRHLLPSTTRDTKPSTAAATATIEHTPPPPSMLLTKAEMKAEMSPRFSEGSSLLTVTSGSVQPLTLSHPHTPSASPTPPPPELHVTERGAMEESVAPPLLVSISRRLLLRGTPHSLPPHTLPTPPTEERPKPSNQMSSTAERMRMRLARFSSTLTTPPGHVVGVTTPTLGPRKRELDVSDVDVSGGEVMMGGGSVAKRPRMEVHQVYNTPPHQQQQLSSSSSSSSSDDDDSASDSLSCTPSPPSPLTTHPSHPSHTHSSTSGDEEEDDDRSTVASSETSSTISTEGLKLTISKALLQQAAVQVHRAQGVSGAGGRGRRGGKGGGKTAKPSKKSTKKAPPTATPPTSLSLPSSERKKVRRKQQQTTKGSRGTGTKRSIITGGAGGSAGGVVIRSSKPIVLPRASLSKRPRVPPITLTTSTPSHPHTSSDYHCPECGLRDDGSPMIGCDGCDSWVHWTCAGVTREPPEDEKWYCSSCVARRGVAKGGKKGRKKKRSMM